MYLYFEYVYIKNMLNFPLKFLITLQDFNSFKDSICLYYIFESDIQERLNSLIVERQAILEMSKIRNKVVSNKEIAAKNNK